eukprot:m.345125 g.345125  ORF g.345125 m.345125 type:complete len:581 (-) comp20656_c0_seq1:654-2396(-)
MSTSKLTVSIFFWCMLYFHDIKAWVPPDKELHLFVDFSGIQNVTGLQIRQHAPTKTYEILVQGDAPWERENDLLAFGYNSLVQVSSADWRIYYDMFGPSGRYMGVAVSQDGGITWIKPLLNIVPLNGSSANNIVLPRDPSKDRIEPGTVFLDTNPHARPDERFKAVLSVNGAASMYASADGYHFESMTAPGAPPLLTGSDTQDVVFWDRRLQNGSGAYVYYGRSHLRGGQHVSCASVHPGASVAEPGRSINRFEIGDNVTHWPVHSADAPGCTIFNTDVSDPPCIDLYTSAVIPVGDAYFFFPMMYNHFDTTYAQGRSNDGLLEARMAVSRDGHSDVHYISRAAWLPRGSGSHRLNHTGVYQGAFDSASTAVARGFFERGDYTIMVGYGSQYTHGGYAGFSLPGGPVLSGLQKLVLRRNGFVSLSTTSDVYGAIGKFQTNDFLLPTCTNTSSQLVLQLNIFVAIGSGATVRLLNASNGGVVGEMCHIAVVQQDGHASQNFFIDDAVHNREGVGLVYGLGTFLVLVACPVWLLKLSILDSHQVIFEAFVQSNKVVQTCQRLSFRYTEFKPRFCSHITSTTL